MAGAPLSQRKGSESGACKSQKPPHAPHPSVWGVNSHQNTTESCFPKGKPTSDLFSCWFSPGITPWCNWDVPSSQAGWFISLFESLSLAPVALGPLWVAQAPSSATSKSCWCDVPISFCVLGGRREGFYGKKGMCLKQGASSGKCCFIPEQPWSCTDPGDAQAGVVSTASLTSRGNKPTPAAGAGWSLARK